MPHFSGIAIPTPIRVADLKSNGQLGFLVSQQYDPDSGQSDGITGYISGANYYVYIVNRIFASGQR